MTDVRQEKLASRRNSLGRNRDEGNRYGRNYDSNSVEKVESPSSSSESASSSDQPGSTRSSSDSPSSCQGSQGWRRNVKGIKEIPSNRCGTARELSGADTVKLEGPSNDPGERRGSRHKHEAIARKRRRERRGRSHSSSSEVSSREGSSSDESPLESKLDQRGRTKKQKPLNRHKGSREKCNEEREARRSRRSGDKKVSRHREGRRRTKGKARDSGSSSSSSSNSGSSSSASGESTGNGKREQHGKREKRKGRSTRHRSSSIKKRRLSRTSTQNFEDSRNGNPSEGAGAEEGAGEELGGLPVRPLKASQPLQAKLDEAERKRELVRKSAAEAAARLNSGEMQRARDEQNEMQRLYGTVDWRAKKKFRSEKAKLERTVAAGNKLAQLEARESERMDAFRVAMGLPSAEAQRQAEWRAAATRQLAESEALAKEQQELAASSSRKSRTIGPRKPH